MVSLLKLCLAALLVSVSAVPYPLPRTAHGIHLPIRRSAVRGYRRRSSAGEIGLGDDADVTYNVLVKVGSVETPVVLDTGSSDLWILSDACTNCSSSSVPLYPTSSFQNSGLSVQLLYGDSSTGTHADGPIGKDTAGIAGLSMDNQYFAAISDTNTSVLETGSAGIFGLGFPINSVIFNTLVSQTSSSRRRSNSEDRILHHFSRPSLSNRIFPDLSFVSGHPLAPVRSRASSVPVSEILASFATLGPIVPRQVVSDNLASPVITITLQRDSFDVGGNAGLLSIGELPPTVDENDLTWVPLRGYSSSEGGLPAPPDSPDEVYPLTWEMFIDDVYFDGQKLPRSNLSSSEIALSALVDTGNSLIRGPADVLSKISSLIGGGNSESTTYPCSEPHTLTFEIGGKMYPVDPRDLGQQVSDDDGSLTCSLNLAVTDPPGNGGFLYSWSLGDPFLKSALVSFYYGNLTYPSQDQPRMGLLSTVPSNASQLLESAVAYASASLDGNLPQITESAPSGTPSLVSTDSYGVAQATASYGLAGDESKMSNSAGRGAMTSDVGWELSLLGLAVWGAFWVSFMV